MDVLVRNLNKVIDINYYPVPETKFQMRDIDQLVLEFKV